MYLCQLITFLRNSGNSVYNDFAKALQDAAETLCHTNTASNARDLLDILKNTMAELNHGGDLLELANHITVFSGKYGKWIISYNLKDGSPFIKTLRELSTGTVHFEIDKEYCGRFENGGDSKKPKSLSDVAWLFATHATASALFELRNREHDTTAFNYCDFPVVIDARDRLLRKSKLALDYTKDPLYAAATNYRTNRLTDIIYLDNVFFTVYAEALKEVAPHAV